MSTRCRRGRHGLPDLALIRGDRVLARVEIKAQGRAFMAVERLLPDAELRPYETVRAEPERHQTLRRAVPNRTDPDLHHLASAAALSGRRLLGTEH